MTVLDLYGEHHVKLLLLTKHLIMLLSLSEGIYICLLSKGPNAKQM